MPKNRPARRFFLARTNHCDRHPLEVLALHLSPRWLIPTLLLALAGCSHSPVSSEVTPLRDAYRTAPLRGPDWEFQDHLHRALYECEILVLQGNNARLTGKQVPLAGYRQRLENCQRMALGEAADKSATPQRGYLQRNAQKHYLASWRLYLTSLSVEMPADLVLKARYQAARESFMQLIEPSR